MLLFIQHEGECIKKYTDFNTSHVTVYRRHWNKPCQKVQISIHLMLLFIRWLYIYATSFWHFNTSHVTVYRYSRVLYIFHTTISIHLMLLFIGIPAILDNSERYFNTSHVTVYPINLVSQGKTHIFQYISCYCLSQKNKKRILYH